MYNPAVEIAGYVYYYSTYYGVWIVISPISGFHSGYTTENGVLRFIRSEISLKGNYVESPKFACCF